MAAFLLGSVTHLELRHQPSRHISQRSADLLFRSAVRPLLPMKSRGPKQQVRATPSFLRNPGKFPPLHLFRAAGVDVERMY